MLTSIRNPRRTWLAFLAAAVSALPVFAGFGDFKLAKSVPADAYMAVHTRDHEGMSFVKEQTKRFWDAICAEHFEKDLQKMIREQMAAEAGDSANTAEFDAQWQQMSDLFNSVDWTGLFTGEMAMSMKIEFPTNQVALAVAPAKADAGAIFDSLSKVAQKLVSMAPEGEIALATTGEGESIVHRVTFPSLPVPMGLLLAREKGVIVMGFGSGYPEQVLALVKGESGDVLAASDRFQAGFKDLPEPVDAATFLDADKLFKQINGMMNEVETKFSAANEDGAKSPEMELGRKLIAQFDAIDFVASVAATKEKQTKTHQFTALKSSAKDTVLYKTFFNGEASIQPLKYVPEGASGFNYGSGVDLNAGYRSILEFVAKEVPDGAALIEQFNQQKATMPFDLEKDLIELVGNKFLSFSLPGRSAYAPGEWAFLIGVNNADHASAKLTELCNFAGEMMKQQQQGGIADANIEGAAGFKTLSNPMLMMVPGLSNPTFGIKDGWFWLGSSPKAIQASLACLSGAAPSFETNARFKAEGEPLGDGVVSASFSDLTKFGEGLASMVGMLPMLSMVNPEINKDPAGRMVLQMATKMGKVLRKLDYLQSSYSRTTRDGLGLKTTTLLNYREPPKPAESSESGEAEKKTEPSNG